jgi:sulfur transfer complex TusBCD TusB component (DsrH family)
MLGMRESHEDWLALGRDLIARGLRAPASKEARMNNVVRFYS